METKSLDDAQLRAHLSGLLPILEVVHSLTLEEPLAKFLANGPGILPQKLYDILSADALDLRFCTFKTMLNYFVNTEAFTTMHYAMILVTLQMAWEYCKAIPKLPESLFDFIKDAMMLAQDRDISKLPDEDLENLRLSFHFYSRNQ